MNETTEIDMDEVKRQMKEEYRAETGEDLPDHVVENYSVLNAAGPTTADLEDAFRCGKKAAEPAGKFTSGQVAAVFLLTAAVAGLIGYGTGTALASNFGVAVVGIVAVAFGFVVGAIASG